MNSMEDEDTLIQSEQGTKSCPNFKNGMWKRRENLHLL